jgi:hypothetical protein
VHKQARSMPRSAPNALAPRSALLLALESPFALRSFLSAEIEHCWHLLLAVQMLVKELLHGMPP